MKILNILPVIFPIWLKEKLGKIKNTEYLQIQNQGHTLKGVLHKGTQKVPVVIVHGYFSSNKSGPYGLYVKIANVLSVLGYNVLRIDLSGMGESSGNINEIDFCNHVSDIQSSIKYLMKYCEASKIHFIGHCIGSCTILQSVLENNDIAKSITLLSPFMPSESSFIRLFMGKSNYKKLLAKGKRYRKGIVCRKSFIDASYIINRYSDINENPNINAFVYFSENDEFVNICESNEWAKDNKVESKIIIGADHNYKKIYAKYLLLQDLYMRFKYFAQLDNC